MEKLKREERSRKQSICYPFHIFFVLARGIGKNVCFFLLIWRRLCRWKKWIFILFLHTQLTTVVWRSKRFCNATRHSKGWRLGIIGSLHRVPFFLVKDFVIIAPFRNCISVEIKLKPMDSMQSVWNFLGFSWIASSFSSPSPSLSLSPQFVYGC